MFKLKPFQKDDLARAALKDGLVLAWDTGTGKTMAMFTWPLLKVGFTPDPETGGLRPARPVLLVVPGDGHDQTEDEAMKHFRAKPIRLDSQATFYRLAKPDPRTGRFTLPPGYFLTSYTQLTGNGVAGFPELDRANPQRTLALLHRTDADAREWWDARGEIYEKHYQELNVTPDSSWADILKARDYAESHYGQSAADAAADAFRVLERITPQPGRKSQAETAQTQKPDSEFMSSGSATPRRFNAAAGPALQPSAFSLQPSPSGWDLLDEAQQQFIRSELAIWLHKECSSGIGEARQLKSKEAETAETQETDPDSPLQPSAFSLQPSPPSPPSPRIKCVYSPSVADLSQDCFDVIVVDEGTKIKGDDTTIGTGVRQIDAPHRLVLTATPVKNRFPDLFHLAHYVSGGADEPTPRFPYGAVDKQRFAEEFLISERNLSKEKKSEDKRRFVKFTPQVCNVHLAWKLLAPIILRRRKDACGEAIVPKLRHVVRVPMGVAQAATYRYHLQAKYRDKNGLPAIGAQLQALRIAAANPASALLVRPCGDGTKGSPRSDQIYIPKVASTLELARQVLERGEQAMIFSAFNDGLDALSARLREAGVPHLVMDGRLSQKRRGEMARQFKRGGPRAVAEGFETALGQWPIALCGADSMAELHSFHLCNNVINTAFSWSFDKLIQGINRAHRLNSPWPVNVWSVICSGSIDRKLEASLREKEDAAGLVLDGHLLGETPDEVSLAELLQIAERDFADVKTLDEAVLMQGWPRLRAALGAAWLRWQKGQFTLAETGKAEPVPAETAKTQKPVSEFLSSGSTPPPPPMPHWKARLLGHRRPLAAA